MAQGELCLERGLWDTGRPPRVVSLARARGALPGRSTLSSASRGIIEKKSEISSERADAENSRGPLSEATRGSEQTEDELGARGPLGEETPGLVDSKGTVAEGDGSKLATGGTSAALSRAGETDVKRDSCETEQKKRKLEGDTPNSETNNVDAKKVKIMGSIININSRVTEEVDENGTSVPAREAEGEEGKICLFRMAVVPVGYPDTKMTQEQAEVVEAAFVERINSTKEGEPIQFSETQYESGALVFTCANKVTKMWLCETVAKIVPWPGGRLEVGQAEFKLKGGKFILFLVGPMKKRKSHQVLKLIQKQNKGICTAQWKVFKRVIVEDKVRMNLWVDEKSIKDLKERNFKLFVGFRLHKLKTWSEWMTMMGTWSSLGDSKTTVQKQPQNPTRNVPRATAVPKFASQNLSRSSVLSSRARPLRQSSGPGLSGPSLRPHIFRYEHEAVPQLRKFESASAHLPRFREARFTESDILRNLESGLPGPEWPREFGFSTSERLLHGERRYTSDRPQENRYFTLAQQQSLEMRYGDPDPPQLRESWFAVSDQMSPRDTRYTASDRALSRDSRCDTLNWDRFENPRYGGSDRPDLRASRFGGMDEVSLQESRLSSFQMQPREEIFLRRDLYSHAPRSTSDISHFTGIENTVSRMSLSRGDTFRY